VTSVLASSLDPKIAEPATKVSAPAARDRAMLSTLTPPSTSSRIGRPLSSMNWRASAILRSAEGMNFWPPNPGSPT
jgi:hypothetical protein